MKSEKLLNSLNKITGEKINEFLENTLSEYFYDSCYKKIAKGLFYKVYVTLDGDFYVSKPIHDNVILEEEINGKIFKVCQILQVNEIVYDIFDIESLHDMSDYDYNDLLIALENKYEEKFYSVEEYLNKYNIDLDKLIKSVLPRLYEKEFEYMIDEEWSEMKKSLYEEIYTSIENLKGNTDIEKIQLELIKKDYELIRFIPEPTEKTQLAVVNFAGVLIRFISNPTEKVKITAIKNNVRAIRYIKNPSEEMQLLAIEKNSTFIKYIENPTEEVQVLSIEKSIDNYFHIHKPTELAKLTAIKKDYTIMRYIKNPTKKIKTEYIKQYIKANDISLNKLV